MRWAVLSMLMLGWGASLMQRIAVSFQASAIMQDLGLGMEQLSWSFSAFQGGLVVGYVLMTALTLVLGVRWGLVVTLSGMSLAMVLSGLISSVPSLLITRAALGFFSAGLLPAAIQVVRELFPSVERPLAIGMLLASGIAARIVSSSVMSLMGDWSWRVVLTATALPTIIAAVLCAVVWKSPPASEPIPSPSRAALTSAAMLVVGLFLVAPLSSFAQMWLFSYREHTGIDTDLAATLTLTSSLAGACAALLVGAVAWAMVRSGNRTSRVRALLLTVCGCIFPLVALGGVFERWEFIASLLVVLSMAHLGWMTLLYAAVADTVATRLVVVAVAAGGVAGFFGEILSSFAFSRWLLNTDKFGAAFTGVGAATALGALVVLLIAWLVPLESVPTQSFATAGDGGQAPFGAHPISLGDWFFSFDGRLNRARYWLGSLALAPIPLVALILDVATTGELGLFYGLAVLLCLGPSLALNVKRCHDRGRSGWFVLVSLIPLVSIWYLIDVGFLEGDFGPNSYGPDPLVRSLHAAPAVPVA